MSLLSQIWDGIRGWVNTLIADVVNPIKAWFSGQIINLRGFIDNLSSYLSTRILNVQGLLGSQISLLKVGIDKLISKVIPDLWAALGNIPGLLRGWVDSAIAFLRGLIDNSIFNLKGLLAKANSDLQAWASGLFAQVPGIADSRIHALLPVGFIKDPLGYVQTAFSKFIEFWISGILASVTQGVEQGTTEAEKELERMGKEG